VQHKVSSGVDALNAHVVSIVSGKKRRIVESYQLSIVLVSPNDKLPIWIEAHTLSSPFEKRGWQYLRLPGLMDNLGYGYRSTSCILDTVEVEL
jgi:hypothetical protein